MHKIKEMLMKELKEYENKRELSPGSLDVIHKLTDTVKNIDKIMMLEEEGGYSEAGYMGGGSYRGGSSYDMGESYARGGVRRDSRGRYSREGGGYSMEGYSRDGGREYMMREMGRLMTQAGSEDERDIIRRCMEQLERV